MRRRLYFLLPQVESARQIHNELLLARVEERHMHFMAKEGIDLKDLPEANLLQKSDLIHGLQTGLIYGGLAGIFAGFAAVPLIGLTLESGGFVVLGITVFGALIGAWGASMVGISAPNLRLKGFEQELEEGHILLMLDSPKGRVDGLTQLIRRYHPEADAHGVERTIPAFP